ncbi:MAG: HAD hydrolase-like protein, partial [Candidatus Sungiibacteriota bacterium]
YALRYDDLVQRGIVTRGLASGAKETFEALSTDRCLYVNSATAHEPLQVIVERLGIRPYFKDIFGMPPTKEENLRVILGREGLDPKEVVVVGDGEGDWRSARATGTHFIAVASGFYDWEKEKGDFFVASGIKEAGVLINKLIV